MPRSSKPMYLVIDIREKNNKSIQVFWSQMDRTQKEFNKVLEVFNCFVNRLIDYQGHKYADITIICM